jgi:DHA1 family bicyclomycin/chloramphenicol resistance-like MFS transporter
VGAEAPPTAPATGRRRSLIVRLGVLTALGPLSTDMYIPGLPELRHSFEATTPAAQLTFSVCLLGMAVGQIIFGPMSDALGRRRPLVWALAGYTVSAIVCVMTPWLWLLIVARLIQGATASAGIVISRAVTRDLFSGREAIVFYARLMLVFGLAPILAPIAGGQIIDLVGWRAVFLVLAVIGAILTAVVHRSMEETLAPERRHDARASDLWRGLGALLRDRTFVRLLVAGTMAQAILMTYLGTAPFVLRSTYGYSAQKFSLVFAANAVGLIGGSQVTSLLAARFGQSAPLRVGVCLAALAGASLPVVAVAGESQLAVLLCGWHHHAEHDRAGHVGTCGSRRNRLRRPWSLRRAARGCLRAAARMDRPRVGSRSVRMHGRVFAGGVGSGSCFARAGLCLLNR